MPNTLWFKLVIALALPQAAGAVGGLFSAANVRTWYPTILKPSFTPPGWVFGPVWAMLYVMMGLALFLVWTSGEKGENVTPAVGIFGAHLFVNALWSVLFFGLKSPFWAFLDLIVLWFLVTALAVVFFRIRRLAGALLVPYWLWVSFAGVLNYVVLRMN
ncbi:MAG: tryptophan-rich sensory protein [Elusimicrobia bacterium]|nr:tryptophan-rich sensory protein [Elusimicrobiota bacterium]